MLNKEQILYLKHQALNLRIDSIRATVQSKSGHPTSCLSIADIVSTIFFNFLRYDLKNPKYQNNDRVILSKGHAIPVIYAAWKQLSVISDDELLTLRKFTSPLEGHPTPRFAYNEATTGSLGQGLSVGLGMALAARMDKLDYTTYVLMGDGEIAEGSIWEAAELAAFYNIDNLIGFVDCNRLGQTGQTL
ncbi:MAG: Transketolase domain protein, partial [candidate division TM6 bacterium GW2011_GWF2_36_6]